MCGWVCVCVCVCMCVHVCVCVCVCVRALIMVILEPLLSPALCHLRCTLQQRGRARTAQPDPQPSIPHPCTPLHHLLHAEVLQGCKQKSNQHRECMQGVCVCV